MAEEFDYISHHHAWKHPQVNVFITLILFIIMKVGFRRACLENVQDFVTFNNLALLVSVLDVRGGHHYACSMWGLHASFSYW